MNIGGVRPQRGWKLVRLGDVITIERRSIRPDQTCGLELLVGMENITNKGSLIDVSTVNTTPIKSNKFQFSSAHVLYTRLGAHHSKIAAPDFSGICSTDILPIKPHAVLNRRFLWHFLRLPRNVELVSNSAVGTSHRRIRKTALAAIQIPLPPMEEQRRIAGVLDAAEALRAKRRQVLARLDSLTHAVFVEMFGDPKSKSTRLNVVPLGELVKLKSGQGLSAKSMQPGSHLVYGGNGVNGTHSEYMFEESKIVIGPRGRLLRLRARI